MSYEIIQILTVIKITVQLLCIQGWAEDNCCDFEDWSWDPVPEYLTNYPQLHLPFTVAEFLRDVSTPQ